MQNQIQFPITNKKQQPTRRKYNGLNIHGERLDYLRFGDHILIIADNLHNSHEILLEINEHGEQIELSSLIRDWTFKTKLLNVS